MRNKRKGDENVKKFKDPEQKLRVGENVEPDTFR